MQYSVQHNVYYSGNTVRLKAVFKDFDGNVVDPTIVKVVLYDYKYNKITDATGNKIGIGVYVVDYITPITGQRFIYEWYGEIDGTPSLRRSSFVTKFI